MFTVTQKLQDIKHHYACDQIRFDLHKRFDALSDHYGKTGACVTLIRQRRSHSGNWIPDFVELVDGDVYVFGPSGHDVEQYYLDIQDLRPVEGVMTPSSTEPSVLPAAAG